MVPSPSLSASLIISFISFAVSFSPKLLTTPLKSSIAICPFFYLSNTSNALRSYCSESESCILSAISVRKYGKVIGLLPSRSIVSSISLISSSVGLSPKLRITLFKSSFSIASSPELPKNAKLPLNSTTYSSVMFPDIIFAKF